MTNSMLLKNPGKNGSYTIRVSKDYAVPKEGVKENAQKLLRPIRAVIGGAK